MSFFQALPTCKKAHENYPGKGDDTGSQQGETHHPVGGFQVAAFDVMLSKILEQTSFVPFTWKRAHQIVWLPGTLQICEDLSPSLSEQKI